MPESPETTGLHARLSAHTAAYLANVERLEALRDRLAAVIEERRTAFDDLVYGEPYWVEDFENSWGPESEVGRG
jgi:hypothetical protein